MAELKQQEKGYGKLSTHPYSNVDQCIRNMGKPALSESQFVVCCYWPTAKLLVRLHNLVLYLSTALGCMNDTQQSYNKVYKIHCASAIITLRIVYNIHDSLLHRQLLNPMTFIHHDSLSLSPSGRPGVGGVQGFRGCRSGGPRENEEEIPGQLRHQLHYQQRTQIIEPYILLFLYHYFCVFHSLIAIVINHFYGTCAQQM